MKRLTYLLAAAASLALFAAQPPTGVTGTFHDLSPTGAAGVTAASGTTGTTYAIAAATGTAAPGYVYTAGTAQVANTVTQVCIYCHAPHQKKATIGPSAGAFDEKYVPLWNHYTTQATFKMYTSPTGTLTGTQDAGPTGISVACLSCHDGTVGLASVVQLPYGQAVAYSSKFSNGGGYISTTPGSGMNIGTDLTGDHPISITYQDNLNPALNAAATLQTKYPATPLPIYNSAGAISYTTGSKVQCSSCHDVHNWQGAAGATSGWFLRVDTAASALCLTCHIK